MSDTQGVRDQIARILHRLLKEHGCDMAITSHVDDAMQALAKLKATASKDG